MRSILDDIFIKKLPTLDLHGEIRDSARVLIKEFIDDNYLLKKDKILIIHGVGSGAIKDETYKVLKSNKKVREYHLNHYNSGCTLVYLNKRSKYWPFIHIFIKMIKCEKKLTKK